MLSAINSPKSKSVSIAFIALKSSILGIILSLAIQNYSQNCTNTLNTNSNILKVFNLLGVILDLFTLIYFYCTAQFSRLQYYVFYFFHIILTVVSILIVATNLSRTNECEAGKIYLTSILSLVIVFHLSAVIVMWSTLYFGLKYAHLGSNIIWSIMWILAPNHCESKLISIVAFIHAIMSTVGFISLIVMLALKKTALTAKSWKYTTILSIIMMIICYIFVLLGQLMPFGCESAGYFMTSYLRYGLIQVISPILILIFLRLEAGDPREKIIVHHDDVFKKIVEHEQLESQQRE